MTLGDDEATHAASGAPIALVRCSTDGQVRWANAAAESLLGVKADDQLADLAEGHEREQLVAYLSGLTTPGRRARAEIATATTTVELLGAVGPDHVITLSVYDLSAFRAELDEVRVSARTDHLTGLANRVAFFEAAQDARMHASIHGGDPAVATVDLDHFKNVNDTFGHATGDRALRHVADILGSCGAEGETVARFGGDEFVICFPDGGVDRATVYTAAVAAALADVRAVAGHAMTLSAAFGVARIDVSADIGVALQEADVALYQAKVRGGAATVVYADPGDGDDLGPVGRTFARLRQHAEIDHRTGLARDHVFDAELPIAVTHATRTKTPLSLLLIDLDRFHHYNERYHYESGHRALRAIATAVSGAVRAGDRCYRYGGEELTVLLPGTGPDEAMTTAERIRQAVEDLAIEHEGMDTRVLTVSIGTSTIGAGDDVEAMWLVHGANVALDIAKTSGRNRVAVAAPCGTAPPIRARN